MMVKGLWQTILATVFLGMGVVLFYGCGKSREQLYKDMKLSRTKAYEAWKNRREQENPSQPYISGKLSLQDSIKLALVHNKILQKILEEKTVAKGEVLASNSAILPSVDLTGSYKKYPDTGFTAVHNYSVDLTITQPVFSGEAIPATLTAARLSSLIADETVRAAVQDVTFNVSRAYYDIVLSGHLYEISEDSERFAQANLEVVVQKKEQGVASEFDVLRAQVALSNVRAELIKNRNTIDFARTSLFKIMGVSQDSEVELSNGLVYEPMTMDMNEAVQTAFENRPELARSELSKEAQKQAVKIAKSLYWPIISAFYTNKWGNPSPRSAALLEWGSLWSVGATAVWPLFDGFSREGEIIKAKARLRQRQIELTDNEETVLFELSQAMFAIENTDEFVQSQQLNLERAQEGLRLAEVGYREGVQTQVEILDARVALTLARSLYYEAIYTHNIAKLNLRRAMGILHEPAAGGSDKVESGKSGVSDSNEMVLDLMKSVDVNE